jgi:sugar lactone lactonase YvrE
MRNQQRILMAIVLSVVAVGVSISAVDAGNNRVDLGGQNLNSIVVNQAALYPEGIEYDANNDRFLLSSVREGTVYQVFANGDVRPFIQDERLVSSTGIHIDAQRNRLLVPNSDYGVSLKSTPETLEQMAALGIYDLSTGDAIAYVDLANLRPGGAHFANDVAVDAAGNAYVTDSLSPILYKVTPAGEASIFLESDRFLGSGFNLNGIVYHPDGYLIMAKKSEGVLFKVPLDNPEAFSQIQVDRNFVGTDGLILAGDKELVVITNRSGETVSNEIFALRSDDGWQSAAVSDNYASDDDYPSTGTIRDGNIYVIKGQLHAYEPDATEFFQQFEIEQIGSIQAN